MTNKKLAKENFKSIVNSIYYSYEVQNLLLKVRKMFPNTPRKAAEQVMDRLEDDFAAYSQAEERLSISDGTLERIFKAVFEKIMNDLL